MNLASILGEVGLPTYSAYSAAKGAVQSTTRVAAMEYAAAGVRINAVLPSTVETDMARYDADFTGVPFGTFLQAAGSILPLGRVGQAVEDIAPVVAFFLSRDASYITGVALPVDGGISAGRADV